MRPARVPAREARAARRNAPSTVSPSSPACATASGAASASSPKDALSAKSHNVGLRSPLAAMNSGTSSSSDAVAMRSSQK